MMRAGISSCRTPPDRLGGEEVDFELVQVGLALRYRTQSPSLPESIPFQLSRVTISDGPSRRLICLAHLPVRHQKRLDPVVMALQGDPIGDGDGAVWNLEAPPEPLG